MDPISRVVAAGAAGAGGAAAAELYVDDVFSTNLYTGTGSSQTITHNIDLAGEGGLIWMKSRTQTVGHALWSSETTGNDGQAWGHYLSSNDTTAGQKYGSSNTGSYPQVTSTSHTTGWLSTSSQDFVNWTFRKAPGFFDVVTWTGNGTDHRALSHSLGSTPGFIAIKASSSSGNWICWHRDLTTNYSILLNDDDAEQGYNRISNIGASSFSVRDIDSFIGSTNASGVSYVAYLFAHDDQSFGTNSDEAIVKCGKYDSVYQTDVNVNLGFEPQWLLIKNIDADNHDWFLYDPMRGLTGDYDGGNTAQRLIANGGSTEAASSGIELNSTGFKLQGSNPSGLNTWGSGVANQYIYIAIRRPHKPPSSGTDVFASQTNSPEQNSWTPGFAPDALFTTLLESADNVIGARLTDHRHTVRTNLTAVEYDSSNQILWDQPTGTIKQQYFQSSVSEGRTGLHYAFKRAPGFFDVVCGTGLRSESTVTHNLGAQPQLIIAKQRSRDYEWLGAANIGGSTGNISLNTADDSYTGHSGNWNTHVTSTTFDPGFVLRRHNGGISSSTTDTYVVYLFGTLSGISKVGNYSGTGNNVDVDCGFAAGARFVLIKRTDSDGDWYVWDSTRGIVSGNDPYLLLNSNAAPVTNTDYIDPLAAGFTVTSSAPAALNTSGGTYLFLAIA